MRKGTAMKSRRDRWSPWWAIVLTCIALLLPLGVIAFGLSQFSYGMSERYMHELAQVIAPVILFVGVFLLVPGVLFLVLRTKILFVVTMVITGGALLTPALVQFF